MLAHHDETAAQLVGDAKDFLGGIPAPEEMLQTNRRIR
jgi:hypothetical protein